MRPILLICCLDKFIFWNYKSNNPERRFQLRQNLYIKERQLARLCDYDRATDLHSFFLSEEEKKEALPGSHQTFEVNATAHAKPLD